MFRVLAVLASLSLAGCGTFLPPKSLDFESHEALDAASKVQTFAVGAVHPEVAKVLGPIDTHSCQYWVFAAEASAADALKRLQLIAAQMNADGIIDVSYDPSGDDRSGAHCWESILVKGSAVKFVAGAAAPVAVTAPAPSPAAITAPIALPLPAAGAGSTVTVAGTARAELLQWVQRLNIPRNVFLLPGPKGGSLDLLDDGAQIERWAVQAPAGAQAAAAGTAAIAPVAGVTTLGLTTKQSGYQINAVWTYNAAGVWELSDEQLKKN